MALKIYTQRNKKLRRVSWISLKRNRIPLFMVIYGGVCILFSVIPTIAGDANKLTFEAVGALSKFYTLGKTVSLLGAVWGLWLNVFLPPAPEYVEETPDQKEGEDVR